MTLLAKFLALPWVFTWLLKRAQKTPYFHIEAPDGSAVYMYRWWLFNPYDRETHKARFDWLPSIRIHRIMCADRDRHLHDHPWDARTFILKGWYLEKRDETFWQEMRKAGETVKIPHDLYHRIVAVSDGGVYTLFVTGKYRHTWGFRVDGKKVPYKEYLQ